jgi:ATP-binding cassette subfamily B (MDR/TAP) protein 1
MGDGAVLEQGTHSELLSHPDGPYTRLVTAQKLRENQDVGSKDLGSSSVVIDDAESLGKKPQAEFPLGRKNTSHSLASNTIDHKRREQGAEKEEDHSLLYLAMRMDKLNRAGRLAYSFGLIAAISKCLVIGVAII